MGEVVNLNKIRKQRRKAERERDAVRNRSQYGLSKDRRRIERGERETDERALDGKRLGSGVPDNESEQTD